MNRNITRRARQNHATVSFGFFVILDQKSQEEPGRDDWMLWILSIVVCFNTAQCQLFCEQYKLASYNPGRKHCFEYGYG